MPSQTADEFDLFMLNLGELLVDISNCDPHFVLITGDLSAKSRNWSIYDTTTSEGAHLDSLMTLYGLNQLVAEPTHVLEHSSSCIDIIFTNQPNLLRNSGIRDRSRTAATSKMERFVIIVNSWKPLTIITKHSILDVAAVLDPPLGIHPTLHAKYHHQIIYPKLNLKIDYPPPYTREIWDYSRVENDLINRSIESFDWPKLFLVKDVQERVIIFSKAILNIFHNFISNKLIMCDDSKSPSDK